MEARRNRRNTSSYRKSSMSYVDGNTVRKVQPAVPMRELERPRKKLSETAKRNRERAAHMNPGYVLFLAVAMMLTGYVCIQYIQLHSDITNHVKNISKLESRYNALKTENDETESRIKESVGLEEIKKRAMDELNMQYANEGQIVTYASQDTDFVRQYIEIE